MGRVWLAAVKCHYKEIARQLKEHFIIRLNDNEMLKEIIRELIKTKESKIMITKPILVLTKWVEVQNVQSTIVNSLSETNDFDRMKTVRSEQRQTVRKPCTSAKQNCSYYGSGIQPDNAHHMGRSAKSKGKAR